MTALMKRKIIKEKVKAGLVNHLSN